MTAQLLWR